METIKEKDILWDEKNLIEPMMNLENNPIIVPSDITNEIKKNAMKEPWNDIGIRKGKKIIDITGKKFNRLTVIAFDIEKSSRIIDNRGHNKQIFFYKCLCDCGNEVSILKCHIKSGRTKSCGCFSRDRTIKMNKNKRLPLAMQPLNSFYSKYKSRCRKNSLEFKLSKYEFQKLIFENCYYCGEVPIRKITNQHFENDFIVCNGIDRINSDIGYSIENCVACCPHCNTAKMDMPIKDFLNLIEKIYKNRILNS